MLHGFRAKRFYIVEASTFHREINMIAREIETDRFAAKSKIGKLCIILVYQQYIYQPPSRTSNAKFRVQNDMLLSMDSMSIL